MQSAKRGNRKSSQAGVVAPAPTDGLSRPELPERKDPAVLAASLLIERALAAAHVDLAKAGIQGVVVVFIVPDTCWTSLVERAWGSMAWENREPTDGFRDRWSRSNWYCWSATEPPRGPYQHDADEIFAKAVSDGQHCLGISAEPSWLPPDLVSGADYRFALPRLSVSDLGTIAERVCSSKPTISVTGDLASCATPRLLRLARRQGQSADAYLAKLQGLLEREASVQSELAEAPVSNAKGTNSIRELPKLDRLHGMQEAVAWGLDLARDIELYRAGDIQWGDVDRGLLLSGPPGCGKTLYARALAATCNVPLITGSYSEWHGTGSAHQGDLLKAMRRTFAEARAVVPSIIFLDEIDSFPNRATLRHDYVDWEIQVVNALLAEIDGVSGRPGVVVIAACNFPEKLDPALTRSGRLDRHIPIGLPDTTALQAILREHLGPDLAGRDLRSLAISAAGATGADCERIVRQARRRARQAGREMLIDDVLAEIDGPTSITSDELMVAAVHEAGHAVAIHELQIGTLSAISIRTSARGGGVTVSDGRSPYLSDSDVRDRLVARLAGRAAEEVVLGRPSSGAGGGVDSDLARATMLATSAACALGLNQETGLVWLAAPDQSALSEILRQSPWLASRVRQVLAEAYNDAVGLVQKSRLAIETVAAALIEHRALEGAEVIALIADAQRNPACQDRRRQ